MSTRLSFWYDAGPQSDRDVFRSVAETSDVSVNIVAPVRTGLELLDVIIAQEKNSIDHVVIAAHGGTRWILNPRHGCVVRGDQQEQIEVWELAKALEPVSKGHLLVSLAACLCSRSPNWFLRATGQRGSNWGPRGYKPGGKSSFASNLRNHLVYYGCDARVRGHRASGHASHCSILAEHRGRAYTFCETLFGRALPNVKPTLKNRRWWTKNVTGDLAQRWLFGDNSVEKEILRLYNRDLRI